MAACSGGPDSVALLQLLIDLDWGLKLTVAHFNHKLRANADVDEEFTRNLARRFSLPFESRGEDIRDYAKNNKLNLEEAGRIRRYAFLEATAAGTHSQRIALGHTLNDQAETVLMHLFRGTGPCGMGGIRPHRGKIIRPLIEIGREDVLAYLKKRNLEYRVDETNVDPRFLRSRIRHRILPFLMEQMHSNIPERLGKYADIIRQEDDFIRDIAQASYTAAETQFQGRPALKKNGLDRMPPALRRRVVREFLRRLRGDTAGLTFEDIERCLELKKEQSFPLEKNLILKNIRGYITRAPEKDHAPYNVTWNGESPLHVPEAEWTFHLNTIPNPGVEQLDFNDRTQVCLDADKIELPLQIRNRCPGDRYRPLGAPGRKKLKEIFRTRDVPPDERDRFPVFLSGQRIIWVTGLPAAHDFRVTDKTATVMKIEVKRE